MRFVGGHHDGMIMVCEHDNMVVPEKTTPRILDIGDNPSSGPMEYHCYTVKTIKGHREEFHVMTPPSMDSDTLIYKLIHGYNP